MDDRIIRTNESIHNGASFLGLSRETVSQGACTDLCCKKPSCDTAVFEKKGEHKCFLFRCQKLCRFSRHSSFSSITIHRHAVSPPPSTSTPPFSTTANSSAPGRGGNHGGVTTSPAPSSAAAGGLPHSDLSDQLQSLPDRPEGGRTWSGIPHVGQDIAASDDDVGLSPDHGQQPGKNDIGDAFPGDLDSSYGPVVPRTDENQLKVESGESDHTADAKEILGMYAQYPNQQENEEMYPEYPSEPPEIAEDYHRYPGNVQEGSESTFQKYSPDLQKPWLEVYRNYQGKLSREHPSELQRNKLHLQSGYLQQRLSPSPQTYQLSGSDRGSQPFDASVLRDSQNNFQSQMLYHSPQIHPQKSLSKPALKLFDVMLQSKQGFGLMNSKRGSPEPAIGQPMTNQQQNEGGMEKVEADRSQDGHFPGRQDLTRSGKNSGPEAPIRTPVTSVLYSLHGNSWPGQEPVGPSPEEQMDVATVGMDNNQPTLTSGQNNSVYDGRDFMTAHADSVPEQPHRPQAQSWDNGHHITTTSLPLHNPDKVNSTGLQVAFPVKGESYGQSESQKMFRQLGLNSSQLDIRLDSSERDGVIQGSDQLHPGDEDQGMYQDGFTDSDYQSPQYRGGKLDSSYSGTDRYAGRPKFEVGPESQIRDGGLSPQGAPLSNSSEGQQPQGKGPHTQGEDPGPVYDYVFIEEKNDTAPEKSQQKEGKPTGDQQTEHQPSSEDQNGQSASKEKQDKQQVSNATILEEETPEKHTTTTTTSRPKHTTKVDSTPPTADRATPKPTSTTPTTSATSPHGQFISREKMGESVKVDDLQVPIIALSVGLSFTLILLVFVGCRLCTVRRQLRKGRPLHSNEADYLINGMYL
ncbi:hypothetical protein ACOMHN_035279 [Nucella lapillus]